MKKCQTEQKECGRRFRNPFAYVYRERRRRSERIRQAICPGSECSDLLCEWWEKLGFLGDENKYKVLATCGTREACANAIDLLISIADGREDELASALSKTKTVRDGISTFLETGLMKNADIPDATGGDGYTEVVKRRWIVSLSCHHVCY